ncbi:hypothetical protein C7M61_005170 [Candidozyma pseudohaemuli]|uniref:separase n=1 Tax=Candidozyma pseudohaemuli TaxID=418784 RepID=A0A2P7YCZ9_9ASCO|nr:hypothetical protein C7M61_005170 [[Candida] pseudohaemulonii]PSK33825.1 hypothetical protein C7M61_005170 [[Candida] pseudohaemulonii]
MALTEILPNRPRKAALLKEFKYERRLKDEDYTRVYDCILPYDLREAVKAHHRLIVGMVHEKKIDLAYQELQKMFVGLCDCRLRSGEVPLSTLLHGEFGDLDHTLVNSYHILLLQTLLQRVSGNLQLIAAGENGFNILIFHTIASSLTRTGSIVKWIEKAPGQVSLKHYAGLRKVATGFLKIIDFLHQKTPLAQLSGYREEWVLLQMKFSRLADPEVQVEVPQSAQGEFLNDLRASIEPQPVPTEQAPNDPLQHVLHELQIDSPVVPSTKLYSRVIDKLGSLLPTADRVDVLDNILLAFDGIDMPSKETFIDCVARFAKELSTNHKFQILLERVLPFALDLAKDKSEMVSSCFRFGNSHQNCAALLLGLHHLPPSVEKRKKQGLRELTLNCLMINRQFEHSLNATVGYLTDHDFPEGSVLRGTTGNLPECVLKSLAYLSKYRLDDLSEAIASLAMGDDSRGQLLLQTLLSIDEASVVSVKGLFSAFTIKDSSTLLFCILNAERVTEVFLSLPKPTTTFDRLLSAAILTNRLKTTPGPVKPFLADIGTHIGAWLRNTSFDDVESETLTTLTRSVFDGGHYAFALYILQMLDEVDSIPLEMRLSLQLLSIKCSLRLGKYEEIPSKLSTAGRLMKQMAESKMIVESLSLVEWKLHQFEYFINTYNAKKAGEKFEEITRFLACKPEFSLSANQSMPLTQTISCLLLNAHFLHLTAKFEYSTGRFALALKNLKLAIKIGVSILKKLSGACDLKDETVRFLLTCYKEGFELAKQAGCLGEAVNMILEMDHINQSFKDSLINAKAHFALADMYLLTGDMLTSALQYEEGQRISSEKDMALLKAMQLSSVLLSYVLNGESKTTLIKSELLETLGHVDQMEAFSSKDLLSDLGRYEYLLSQKESIVLTENNTDHSPQTILLKTIASARQEILDVKSAIIDKGNAIVIPSGLAFTSELNEKDLSIVDKLLDCKDTLLRFLENDYSQLLGVEELKDLQNTLTRCIFTLSQITVVKEEGAESLLKDVFYLLELPRVLPYQSLTQIHRTEQKSNEIMPTLSTTNLKNVHAKELFFGDLSSLLPKDYVVITIDCCAQSGDLILSKLQKGLSIPSLLRLSLERGASQLTPFWSVMEKLVKIIDESHKTTNLDTTRNIRTKEERKDWWKRRFILDAKLKNVLDNVGNNWLGGFKGLLELTDYSSTEFLFFKSELQRVWKKSLGVNVLDFSDTITELYFNLTPSGNVPLEIKHLQDLIKYTASELGVSVDERKLVNEIKKILPTKRKLQPQHLVLLPSHTCSDFPWESIDFLRSKSISRVPSITCLLELLKRASADLKDGHLSYYVLNPGGDLKKTELRFKTMFASMARSNGIAGQTPNEEELFHNLFRTDLFVYAGHGGGEQYMRMNQLLKKSIGENLNLPPAILMGCSSGASQKHGRLEPSSNIMVWLLCGSPMIVSNLWDITDKDIDAFSSDVLERWGLIGNLKERSDIASAVAKSRDTCVLKYLNGAAPIVHGLPIRRQ